MSGELYIVISTPTTDKGLVKEAVDEVRKTMGDVEEQVAPELFSEWYHCPALKMPTGQVIFGIDGIRMYVERYRAEERRGSPQPARLG